jgi:microcystin-dependent protein
LGIVKGDALTKLEEAIASKLCALDVAVDMSTATLCPDLVALIGTQDRNAGNLLKILLTYSCTLKGLIDSLTTQVGETQSLNLDFKCIEIGATGDPCDPTYGAYTVNTVLQILIDNICDLKVAIDQINSTISTTVTDGIGTALANMLSSCMTNRITPVGSGASTKIMFSGFVPPFVALPYFGPLTHFDASGKGADNSPYCGFYLCNGLNGTPDMRGRVPVGAVNGVGGGALHQQVDPSLPHNSGAGYSINDIGGEVRHKNTINEMPDHGHTASTQPHSHSAGKVVADKPIVYPNMIMLQGNTDIGLRNVQGDSATVQVTIGNTGGDAFHENRMPYRACAFIMMIN